MEPLLHTHLDLPGQRDFYRGKVRDVYSIGEDYLLMVATDRLSAFDVVLPQGIPHKGEVLNQMANHFLDQTKNLVPNWKISKPDPNVTFGRLAQPFKVEMVIRGYLAGHAWREYQDGRRSLCGVELPEGLRQNDPLPEAIITPTTKAEQGDHDADISREEILRQNLVRREDYELLESYTRQLFAAGQAAAAQQGLILVDTKYEFGKTAQGEIILIDELHTPDSSRYFYAADYHKRQELGQRQEQLSKEFVREWLMEQGFQGKPGQTVPQLPEHFVQEVSQRYQELYGRITGRPFEPFVGSPREDYLRDNILNCLESYL